MLISNWTLKFLAFDNGNPSSQKITEPRRDSLFDAAFKPSIAIPSSPCSLNFCHLSRRSTTKLDLSGGRHGESVLGDERVADRGGRDACGGF